LGLKNYPSGEFGKAQHLNVQSLEKLLGQASWQDVLEKTSQLAWFGKAIQLTWKHVVWKSHSRFK